MRGTGPSTSTGHLASWRVASQKAHAGPLLLLLPAGREAVGRAYLGALSWPQTLSGLEPAQNQNSLSPLWNENRVGIPELREGAAAAPHLCTLMRDGKGVQGLN